MNDAPMSVFVKDTHHFLYIESFTLVVVQFGQVAILRQLALIELLAA